MNRTSLIAIGCAAALLAAGPATAANFGGEWNMSEGRAQLTQRGSEVTGTYSQDNGRIEGTVRGRHFSGYWGEDGSAETCGSTRLGTRHWGRIEWDLAADGNSFDGKWSYCDKEVGSPWTGTRIGAAPPDEGEDEGDNGDDNGDDNGQYGGEGWNVPGGGEPQVVYDNGNTARCDYTDYATLPVDRPMFLAKIELWADWDRVGSDEMSYRVELDGDDIGGGTLTRGACDPYQTNWCVAADSPSVKVTPGDYVIRVEDEVLCQNGGSDGQGFIRAYDP